MADHDIERIADLYADPSHLGIGDPDPSELERFILADEPAPCLVCAAPTHHVEVNYEAPVCPGCLPELDRRGDGAGVMWTGLS